MTRPAPIVRLLTAALALALGSLAVCGPAAAQELNFGAVRPDQRHVLHLGAGVEDAAVVSLGYSRLLPVLARTLALTSELDLVPVHTADWRLRAGAAAPIASYGRWMAGGKALGIVRNASNAVNRMTNLGVETSAWVGFYDARWFVAAEAGVDWAAATYIKHTERYRQVVYADAKDGLYSSTGASVVYGVFGGYSFTSFDLVLSAGQRRDFQLDTWMLPFYATVGVNVRLPAWGG